jgi:hypothetical protein
MTALIKKLLIASALVLGLGLAAPAVAQEETEGTEQVQPAPEEGTAEEAPAEPAPAEEGTTDEAEAPEQGAEESPE